MLEWLHNFSTWIDEFTTPFVEFFKSTIHGLSVMIKMFPKILNLVSNSILYLPSIFTVFITITIVILVAYMIIGRAAGSTE